MQLKLYVVVSVLTLTASMALNLHADMKIPHASHSAIIRSHRQTDASLTNSLAQAETAETAETVLNSLA